MHRKIAIIFVLLASIWTSTRADALNGGIARQIAMGGSMAGSGLVLNPFIMNDPALLLLNPAYQATYKDYVWMNIGGGMLSGLSTANNGYGQQEAGIAFSVGDEWSFGALLSHDPSAVRALRTLLTGAASPGFGLPNLPSFVGMNGRTTPAQTSDPGVANVWEAVAGLDLGALDLGFGFMYGHSNSDGKSVPAYPNDSLTFSNEASSRVFGFRLGMNYDMGSGSSIDASAALRLGKVVDNIDRSPATVSSSLGDFSVSGTEFQFSARGKFKMSKKVNFVPYGMIATLSAEPKVDTKPGNVGDSVLWAEKVTALAYAFGAGIEYRTSTFYLAGGLSVQSASAKLELTPPPSPAPPNPPGPANPMFKATYFALPVLNLGGEWWFLDWLAGRAGYYRSLGSVKLESQDASGARSSTETNLTVPNSWLLIGGITPATHDGLVTLGLGMRFGNFALDATVSEEALRRGLGVIGAQDNINTFGYLTASFNFAGE